MSAREDTLVMITLKDLASWVSFDQSEEGIAKTMRQIRHWTQNDLLQTRSQKNTGKGIPRLYSEEPTLQIAGILAELSRYASSIDVLKPVAEALYEEYEEGALYLSVALTEMNAFLQVAWTFDPKTQGITGAETTFFDEIEDWNERVFNFTAPSSILINMSQVSERIYDNKFGGIPYVERIGRATS
ncbi:hypothetical protein [Magnetospira sp. QH-2]|uniref:hypothetical protein n=1 Tax=Magnetospira sp. (strain QH-2) TaxID=1288970 RepID=UPI0003E812FE|nr:hypothetical protein [Magnetospira sp. QH-2]CCQ72457.1 protein of unknown function [Magnetospira sp. QH-2]